MRALVLVVVLVAMVLVATGCTTGGGAQLETKYCIKCQTYHPLDHTHFQEAAGVEEAAPEGSATK